MSVERAEVALSAEALGQQAARAGAEDGAAFVIDREIAGRVRGGIEWRAADPLAVAVVARPVALDPASAQVAWLAAALAASSALDVIGPRQSELHWPDRVTDVGIPELRVVSGAMTLLGPGRVDAALLVVRLDPVSALEPGRREITDVLVDAIRSEGRALRVPHEVASRFRERSTTIGRTVRIELLPAGVTRGRAVDIGHDGSLVLVTPTGLTEDVPIANVGAITLDGG